MAKARPPIIISNGSIAALLTEGLIANPEGERGDDPIAIIRDNIDGMNERHIAAMNGAEGSNEKDIMILAILKETEEMAPRIYWRRYTDVQVQVHPIYGKGGRNYYETTLEA